jgi:hypothetical protein
MRLAKERGLAVSGDLAICVSSMAKEMKVLDSFTIEMRKVI